MRSCICIDLKSYYASVECVHRGLDPLKANLLVADESRSDQTICLAVSPALKAAGVPGRPRLFEAKQAIRRYEASHRTTLNYIIARPRMKEYERISAHIFSIYMRFAAPEDIHVYSIDECFIDCTAYLHFYSSEARRQGTSPAHLMAMEMIRAVLKETGITATAGIGTNLYLAKVAMDIVAKRSPPDRDGVRIASLNEDTYKLMLWEHRPLTDFWQIGPGKARTLQRAGMYTFGDIAERSLYDEEWFYRAFGIDGEILIDHAWGIEPVTIRNIKEHRSERHSLASGQVLPRPYEFSEARMVLREMAEGLCADMFKKRLVSRVYTWWVSYDYKSLDICPSYSGPLSLDFYGRLHPKHTNGTVRLPDHTNSTRLVSGQILSGFDKKTDRRLLFRRLGVCAADTRSDDGLSQLELFTDYETRERDRRLAAALLSVRSRYGSNAVFKGTSLMEGATALERNMQIGGHRA